MVISKLQLDKAKQLYANSICSIMLKIAIFLEYTRQNLVELSPHKKADFWRNSIVNNRKAIAKVDPGFTWQNNSH